MVTPRVLNRVFNSTELYRKREIQRHHIAIWKGANEERVRVAAAGGKAGRGGNSIVRGDALAWEAWPGLRPAWNILEI